jgi:hypothetical protein
MSVNACLQKLRTNSFGVAGVFQQPRLISIIDERSGLVPWRPKAIDDPCGNEDQSYDQSRTAEDWTSAAAHAVASGELILPEDLCIPDEENQTGTQFAVRPDDQTNKEESKEQECQGLFEPEAGKFWVAEDR